MEQTRITDPKIIRELMNNPEHVEYLVIIKGSIYAKYHDNDNLMKIAQAVSNFNVEIIKKWKMDKNILFISQS